MSLVSLSTRGKRSLLDCWTEALSFLEGLQTLADLLGLTVGGMRSTSLGWTVGGEGSNSLGWTVGGEGGEGRN